MFRKIIDYSQFERVLSQVSLNELEEMSKNPANEETFMNFLRYISLLNQSDIKKQTGQKLIDKIFEIQKF